MYKEGISDEEKLPKNWHPVLHVTLTSKATVASLGADILHAMGELAPPPQVVDDLIARGGRRRFRDHDDPKGTIPQILHLAVRALALAKIELLVIDEMQHLIQSETQKTMWSVADAIKWLSIKGVCAICCVGIRSILNVISATSNRSQFAIRCRPPILLDPVDMEDSEQRVAFMSYLLALDERLVSHGIFKEGSDLVQRDWIDCFYDVSHGILGRVSRLVETAAGIAIREGRDRITHEDLSFATERWAMTLQLTDHDPWRKGARDYREIAKLAEMDY